MSHRKTERGGKSRILSYVAEVQEWSPSAAAVVALQLTKAHAILMSFSSQSRDGRKHWGCHRGWNTDLLTISSFSICELGFVPHVDGPGTEVPLVRRRRGAVGTAGRPSCSHKVKRSAQHCEMEWLRIKHKRERLIWSFGKGAKHVKGNIRFLSM